MSEEHEYLLLKWGTIKGWNVKSDAARNILREYVDIGTAYGVMQRVDSPRQKELLCQLIDVVDGAIQNDWSGEIMSKEAAKKYIMEYRR